MRWIGAILVVACCGYFGFSMVVTHKKEEKTLIQLISAINYMECELQYRLTPLPQLIGQASQQISGLPRIVFAELAEKLKEEISPQVSCCMETVLKKQKDVPQYAGEAFSLLGQCLGKFDLQGQLKELDWARNLCVRHLKELENNRDARLRSYQTLGLCAGAALAIILL